MNNNKMPDGSFAVDSEQFEIVRDTKAPYIPVVKSKGGSSELPEVTAEDNGKVLGVVDGEWDKTEAGGGSGAMVVNFEVDYDRTITADKTVAEVKEAIRTKPVIGIMTMTSVGMTWLVNAFGDASENGYEVAFATFGGDSLVKAIASEDDDWVLTMG